MFIFDDWYEAAKKADGIASEADLAKINAARALVRTASLEELQASHAEAVKACLAGTSPLKLFVVCEALSARLFPPALRRLPDCLISTNVGTAGATPAMLVADLQWLALTVPNHKPASKSWGRVLRQGNWRLWVTKARGEGAGAVRRVHRAKGALRLSESNAKGCATLGAGSFQGVLSVNQAERIIRQAFEAERLSTAVRAGRFAHAGPAIIERRAFFWRCREAGVNSTAATHFWEQLSGERVRESLVSVDAGRAAQKIAMSEQAAKRKRATAAGVRKV